MRTDLNTLFGGAVILVLSQALAGCGQTASIASPSGPGGPTGPVTITGAQDDLVKTIIVPQDEPRWPAGPGVEVFLSNCATCHSTRYVSMQPPFARTVWTAEVQKMVKTFGAALAEPQMGQVVDYLVFYQEKTRSAVP